MTLATHFTFHDQVLRAEQVALPALADALGTPLYVYSRQALHDAWRRYRDAVQGRRALICYGMKANSNLSILQEFNHLGAGFDIVSGGELARVLAVGGDASRVVFSGVGKQDWEMRAALKAGVKCFNVESVAELHELARIARELHTVAPVALRVNPDVDARTHPYISTGLKENKFGIAMDDALDTYAQAAGLAGIRVVGITCHIGSQILDINPYLDALEKLCALVQVLAQRGITLEHLDLGGGIGIRYQNETPPSPKQLVDRIFAVLAAHRLDHLQLVLEPGRSLVGNAGVLVTRVLNLKHTAVKNFAIVDAAMNDLLRPALYSAWHDVLPVVQKTGEARRYDIVGPVCESADWLARERVLDIAQGDLLAVLSAGAYAFVMSSQYNSRARAAEVLVDGDQYHVVRPRESLEDLFSSELQALSKAVKM